MTRLAPFPLALRAAGRATRPRRSRLDQFALAPTPRQAAPEPDLSQEEERSLLGSILGGVQYVGETLDKPGAAVRGLLAGKPGQLLNLIPFSDTLGITETEDRVSGRDLLETAGVLRRNRPGLDWGDAAGFAAEVALDPLTWMLGPLAASTKAAAATKAAGRATGSADELALATKAFEAATRGAPGEISAAARKIRTPATYAEQIRLGEQPIAQFKVPFAKKAFYEFTLGKRASEAAARALESMFYGGNILNPIVGARSLFSHTAGEAFSGAAQRLKDIKYAEKTAMTNAVMDVAPSYRQASNRLQKTYQEIAKAHEAAGDLVAFNQFTRAMVEAGDAIPQADEMMRIMARTMGLEGNALNAVENVDEIGKSFDAFLKGLKNTENIAYERARQLGMRGEELNDIFTSHFGRRPSNPEIFTSGEAKLQNRAAQDAFEFAMGRNVIWRHVPGGTRTINQWAMDDTLLGTVARTVPTLPEAQARAAKGIAPGAVVHAADRGNYGKVLSVEGDKATVFFRSPQGATARVKLPVKELEVKYRGAPRELMEETVHYTKQTTDEQVKRLQRALTEHNIPFEKDVSLSDLQMSYFRDVLYEPELARAWQNGVEKRWVGYGESKSIDETIRGPAKELDRKEFRDSFFETVGEEGKTRAEAMVSFFGKHAQEIRAGGLFDRRVVDDWFGYMTSLAHTESTLRSTHRFLKQLAGSSAVRFAAEDDLGMVSLSKTWADAGFHRRGLDTFVRENVDQFDGLAKELGGAADEEAIAGILGKAVDRMVVDEAAAGGIKAFKEITQPKTQNAVFEMFDKVSSAYKSLLTLPWPAFHARNHAGGWWNALTDGNVNALELTAGHAAAFRHMRTGGKKPAEFIDEFIENDVMGTGQLADIAGEQAARKFAIPEGPTGGVLGVFKTGLRERGIHAINPLSTPGVVKNPKFIFGEAGERAYETVEFFNRYGYYDALRKKGFSPSEAKRYVDRSQMRYDQLSQFEKRVARKAFLFYTFSRKNIPLQLTKLAERPGGAAAQTYRAFNQQDPDEFAPSFTKEGLAIRTGGPNEAAHFIKQSGIPIEDLNMFVFRDGLPAGRTLEKAAARLHPLLNLPIESFAEKQLFTGRKRKNLRSTTEALSGAFGAPTPVPWLDRALHYSPISRVASELMGVIDERKSPLQKALNALTGVKTSTYDVDKWRLIDLQNALQERIAASPYTREGTYSYVPERYRQDAAAAGPQEQIRLMRALAKATKRLQESR